MKIEVNRSNGSCFIFSDYIMQQTLIMILLLFQELLKVDPSSFQPSIVMGEFERALKKKIQKFDLVSSSDLFVSCCIIGFKLLYFFLYVKFLHIALSNLAHSTLKPTSTLKT